MLYVYVALTALAPPPPVDTLPLRSSYVGLGELYASGLINATALGPIMNTPRLLAQLHADAPRRMPAPDGHLRLTPYGRMLVPDHHLVVSRQVRPRRAAPASDRACRTHAPQTHSLYQFRVIDFGMERCQLALSLPPLGVPLDDPYTFRASPSSNASDTVLLDVCEAPVSSRVLDMRALSWAARPACARAVGTFAARAGAEVTLPEFACKWGEVRTFELSCAPQNPDCALDVWANQTANWGEWRCCRSLVRGVC